MYYLSNRHALTQLARPQRARNHPTTSLRLGKPRAALIVYRYDEAGQPRLLMITAKHKRGRLTLPGGKIDRNETAARAAIRETREESGVLTHTPRPMGCYLHRKRKGRVHPTDTFLAGYAGQLSEREPRELVWLSPADVESEHLDIKKPIRKQLRRAFADLAGRAAAAA